MKETAVVICNWNKKEYVLACIDSVLNSTYRDFDLIVVDNASTDGSAQAIRERFGAAVTVIENERNTGGAGGFNTGIRRGLQGTYEFIHLLDNDVVVDERALELLVAEMKRRPELGIAGSLICDMDHPRTVQEMGADIDWDAYHMRLNYKGHLDNGQLPERVECDYVPACSMLVRSAALRLVGGMDERFFIYWDDIDLCHRIRLHGYRVCALSPSKVWHKRGVAVRTDTFANYYVWRNRVHFFLAHCPEERFDHFADTLFGELVKASFIPAYKGVPSVARSIMRAVDDAVHGIRGKAQPDRIYDKEAPSGDEPLSRTVNAASRLAIVDGDRLGFVREFVQRVRALRPDLPLRLVGRHHGRAELAAQLPDVEAVDFAGWSPSAGEAVCQLTGHILEERNRLAAGVSLYVDPYYNTIASEDDRRRLRGYDDVCEFYRTVHYPILNAQMRERRALLRAETAQ